MVSQIIHGPTGLSKFIAQLGPEIEKSIGINVFLLGRWKRKNAMLFSEVYKNPRTKKIY